MSCKFISTFTNYFSIIDTIGKGQFGLLYLASPNQLANEELCEMPEKVVLKIVQKNKFNYDEVRFLKALNIDGFMKFYGCYSSEKINILVLEFLEGANLYKVMTEGDLNESQKLQITQDLAKIIIQLHSKNIVHRDIKPDNIIVNLSTGKINLIDYGLSCSFVDNYGHCSDIVGSLAYLDPRILETDYTYEKEDLIDADWWSYYITIFELWEGYLPIEVTKTKKTFKHVMPNIDRMVISNMPDHIWDMIQREFFNERKRLSGPEILKVVMSDTGMDMDMDESKTQSKVRKPAAGASHYLPDSSSDEDDVPPPPPRVRKKYRQRARPEDFYTLK